MTAPIGAPSPACGVLGDLPLPIDGAGLIPGVRGGWGCRRWRRCWGYQCAAWYHPTDAWPHRRLWRRRRHEPDWSARRCSTRDICREPGNNRRSRWRAARWHSRVIAQPGYPRLVGIAQTVLYGCNQR
jgi:hypothetical protein